MAVSKSYIRQKGTDDRVKYMRHNSVFVKKVITENFAPFLDAISVKMVKQFNDGKSVNGDTWYLADSTEESRIAIGKRGNYFRGGRYKTNIRAGFSPFDPMLSSGKTRDVFKNIKFTKTMLSQIMKSIKSKSWMISVDLPFDKTLNFVDMTMITDTALTLKVSRETEILGKIHTKLPSTFKQDYKNMIANIKTIITLDAIKKGYNV